MNTGTTGQTALPIDFTRSLLGDSVEAGIYCQRILDRLAAKGWA